MGFGDFLEGAGKAAGNVVKGAAWAARPDHWDNIAEGVGNVGEFVAEHPGQVWDVGFEVGREVLKDQLKPQNLAINAALLGASVLTGGAALPAFAAKVGLGAKAVKTGVEAAEVGKAVGTGVKTLKAADTALDAAKVAKTVDKATDIARGLDTAADAVQGSSKLAKVGNVIDKAAGMEPTKLGRTVSNVLNPLENSRFGMAAMRDKAAQRILTAGGESPGLLRQAGAAAVQSGGRGAGAPNQLAGMSDRVYDAQRAVFRTNQLQRRAEGVDTAQKAVPVLADPEEAVYKAASKKVNEEATDFGYVDRGQTRESMYGNDDPQTPANEAGGGQSGGGNNWGPPLTPPPNFDPANGPNEPGGDTSSQVGTMQQPGKLGRRSSFDQGGTEQQETKVKTPGAEQTEENALRTMGGGRGTPFWTGSRAHAYSGISSNYDWRGIEPLRPINVYGSRTASRGQRKMGADAPKNVVDAGATDTDADTDFSPEIGKGQSTADTALPKTEFDLRIPEEKAEWQTVMEKNGIGDPANRQTSFDLNNPADKAAVQDMFKGKDVRIG